MTDENKDTSSLELLKSVQVWIATLSGLMTAVTGTYLLMKKEPQLAVLIVSGVGALVLWVMLWRLFRAKKRISTHDPTKKVYRHSKQQRAWALIGLIALPALECVVVYVVTRPPTLPDDRLVVAVADFTPVGGDDKVAERFTYSLNTILEHKSKSIPLQPKPLNRHIEASNPSETKKQAATNIGRSREGLAHVVLWGDVVKNETDYTIRPFIAFTESLRKINIDEAEIGWFPDSDAGSFQFKEIYAADGGEAAGKIADIVTFIEGLMYYKLANWKEAKRIFDTLSYPTKPVEFYKGLCLYELAQRASDSDSNLEEARSAFGRALGDPPWKLNDELNCASLVNMVSATAMLSSSLQPKTRLSQLQEIEGAYQNALQLCRSEDPQNAAFIKNNLGNVLVETALLSADEGKWLNQAIDVYTDALPAFSKNDLNAAIVQNNRGTAYTELGCRVDGDEANRDLQKALAEYDAALRVFTYKKSQNNWATININRSLALTELGRREGVQGDGRLREAVGVLRNVLVVVSQRQLDTATAKINLANALREQAQRRAGDDGKSLLGEAVQNCRDAIPTFTKGDLDWVLGQEMLGDSLLDLALRGGDGAIGSLQEAIDVYKAALSIRDTIEHNQDWTKTQNRIGIASVELQRINPQ